MSDFDIKDVKVGDYVLFRVMVKEVDARDSVGMRLLVGTTSSMFDEDVWWYSREYVTLVEDSK